MNFTENRTSIWVYSAETVKIKSIFDPNNTKSWADCIREMVNTHPMINQLMRPSINPNPIRSPTGSARQHSHQEKCENIPLIESKNPLQSKFPDLFSNSYGSDYSSKVLRQIVTRLDKDIKNHSNETGGFDKLLKMYFETNEGYKKLLIYAEERDHKPKKEDFKITTQQILLFCLVHNLSPELIDSLRKEVPGLAFLPSTSAIKKLLGLIHDHCRRTFEIKVIYAQNAFPIVNISPEKVILKVEELLSAMDIPFDVACLSSDVGRDISETTLKPLVQASKRAGLAQINQMAELTFPIRVSSSKDESWKMLQDIHFANFPKELVMVLDLGMIFSKHSCACPLCFRKLHEYGSCPPSERQDLPSQDDLFRKYGIQGISLIIICILHLDLRVVTVQFLDLLKGDRNSVMQSKLRKWVRDNVRSSFEFGEVKDTRIAEALTDAQISAWMNHNECITLLRMRKSMLDVVGASIEVRKLWELTFVIVEMMNTFSVIDWQDNENWNRFSLAVDEHSRLFINEHGNHTHYTHILVEHVRSLIIWLMKRDLSIFDLANFSLENLHCLMNNVNVFHSNVTYVPAKEGCDAYLLPYHRVVTEVLRIYSILLLRINPDNLCYHILKRDKDLQEFRQKRIETDRKPFVSNMSSQSDRCKEIGNYIQYDIQIAS